MGRSLLVYLMATWSGFSFGGWDPIGSWFEGNMNRSFNRMAYEDQLYYSALAAQINYDKQMQYARESPSAHVEGLERAGLNPILAANSSAGSYSSLPLVSGLPIRSESHSSFGGASPLEWSLKREQRVVAKLTQDKLKSDIETQNALCDLYKSQAMRNSFVPLNETTSGGINFLGSGFNVGGTNTLLFDTRSGDVIRPVSTNSAATVSPAPRSSNSAKGRSDSVNVAPGLKDALEKRGISLESLMNMQE